MPSAVKMDPMAITSGITAATNARKANIKMTNPITSE